MIIRYANFTPRLIRRKQYDGKTLIKSYYGGYIVKIEKRKKKSRLKAPGAKTFPKPFVCKDYGKAFDFKGF